MPYIESKDRDKLMYMEKQGKLYEHFTQLSLKELAGHLNFHIFKIVKLWIAKNGKKYFSFATIVGTLICCVLEIYRRLIAPYEDEKKDKNGDI